MQRLGDQIVTYTRQRHRDSTPSFLFLTSCNLTVFSLYSAPSLWLPPDGHMLSSALNFTLHLSPASHTELCYSTLAGFYGSNLQLYAWDLDLPLQTAHLLLLAGSSTWSVNVTFHARRCLLSILRGSTDGDRVHSKAKLCVQSTTQSFV